MFDDVYPCSLASCVQGLKHVAVLHAAFARMRLGPPTQVALPVFVAQHMAALAVKENEKCPISTEVLDSSELMFVYGCGHVVSSMPFYGDLLNTRTGTFVFRDGTRDDMRCI